MFRRTFKRLISTNPGIEDIDIDETGVDIVEALNFVNSVQDEDASKDFSEKEIKIPETKAIVSDISLGRACLLHKIQPNTAETVKVKTKQNPARFKPKTKITESKFRRAIQRGRLKFCEQLSFHQIQIFLPSEIYKEVSGVTDLFEESTKKGIKAHSLQEFMCQDNIGKLVIHFSVKVFTRKSGQWLPSKIECYNHHCNEYLEIFTRPSISFKIPLQSVELTKIEDNRRILWMKSLKSMDVVGLLFDKIQTLERFMLLLDYARRCRKPSAQHPFLNGCLKLSLPEKPCLFSCEVTLTRYHHLKMEFLGQFSYHLKTSSKEIKSLEPAQLFCKAGYIYVFEKDSDTLPIANLKLNGSTCSINHSFNSSLVLTTETQILTIFTKTLPVSQRIHEIIGNREVYVAKCHLDFKIFVKVCDNGEASQKMNCLLGICNDQLVWTVEANEIVWSEAGCDNEHVDTSINNHVNDCQDASEIILGFNNIIHVAVDSQRCLIQIAAAPAPRVSEEDCSGHVGVGGTIMFNNERDMFRFQHTLQTCWDLNIFNVNLRQNSRLL